MEHLRGRAPVYGLPVLLFFQLFKQVGGDSQSIAAGWREDLLQYGGNFTHHDGFIAMLFKAVVDIAYRFHAGIFLPTYGSSGLRA